MKLSDLTEEILVEITRIYDRINGTHIVAKCPFHYFPISSEDVKKGLLRPGGRPQEFRFRARDFPEAKLHIEGRGWTSDGERLIQFTFDANISPYASEKMRNKEQKRTKEFEQAIDEFLTEQGLAYQE